MSRGFPSMTALLGLLAVAGYQNRDKLAELFGNGGRGSASGAGMGMPGQDVQQGGYGQSGFGQQSGSQGGLGGLLGGLAGGGGIGALLGGLGGGGATNPNSFLSGGLSELMERFRQNGYGDRAESWVQSGPNREVAPNELEQAIGPDVLDDLTAKTGLSRQELLSRLSTELPRAVDQYTPDGRLPGHPDA
jgi:uncharacterized protein YidB (DUF937 family)